ncbi:MAG: serine/threonine-protein kinase [Polyangiaceae bacterium]
MAHLPLDPKGSVAEPGDIARLSRDSIELPTLVKLENASHDPAPSSGDKARYQLHHELGKGGMGVVQLCRDKRIGRDVALKAIRPESKNDKDRCARFLREARVQGQLEHPGIVPVYDVGADDSGAMFFTMKRLHGMTLSQVVKGLRNQDPAASAIYTRRKLLTAFSALCLTVDYAHSRGVVHRDIKPSNVMLGDFGEVYLLDWGIAKIVEGPVTTIDMSGAGQGQTTVPGEMLGTPGYIAPEQAYGQNERLDARTDVYSLGCILFELLTYTPLHPRRDVLQALQSTTDGADARASVRAPDRQVPPELDEICVKATARKQVDRYPSARALHQAVERFLDGDRDLEMRHTLASEHAARAERAVERALSATGLEAENERRTALREVGHALAFEPTNERALSAMHEVFIAPPREVPTEVQKELVAIETGRLRFHLRGALWSELLGVLMTLPALLWMGLRSVWIYLWLLGATLLAVLLKVVAIREEPGRRERALVYASFLCNAVAVLSATRVWGPLFVMPLLLVAFTFGYSYTPWVAHRRRVLLTAILVQLGAVGVELSGIVSPSYEFAGGAITILPVAVTHSAVPTTVSLTCFVLFMLFMPLRIIGRAEDALRETETRALVQSWQLRQLLPQPVRSAKMPPAR